jgi:hypothetical protein
MRIKIELPEDATVYLLQAKITTSPEDAQQLAIAQSMRGAALEYAQIDEWATALVVSRPVAEWLQQGFTALWPEVETMIRETTMGAWRYEKSYG